MKVILCTPYIQSSKYVQGGVVVWGANIVNYYNSLENSDVELIPISLDRQTYFELHRSKLRKYLNGIKELLKPTLKAINLMRKGGIDVIHISTSLGSSVLKDELLVRAARHYGVRSYLHFHCGRVPVVLHNHDGEHKKFIRNLKFATKGITMDMRSYHALIDYGIENVVNLPNPLSLSIINLLAERKTSVKRIPGRIAFVGHVLKSKGIFELIESCCKIGTPDLHIIGKVLPNDRLEIDKLLSRYHTDSSWITWTGEIPHTQVIEELLAAEFFAFPSYSEGFPNVILEAMACGCTIVSTKVGAIPEMLDIAGDACGVCVEPQDTDAFYEALRAAYNHDSSMADFAHKAELRVNQLYTVDKVWRLMVKNWEK